MNDQELSDFVQLIYWKVEGGKIDEAMRLVQQVCQEAHTRGYDAALESLDRP